ncbi:MAG: hypothetical protein AABX70_06995 [Nanoarchaeota archaeon]
MAKVRTRKFRRISTPYMTRIVPLDELLITTTGRTSLEAPASQLQPGDQVLHDVEYVDQFEREGELVKRQELVLEALLQDPTYVRANQLLHVQTESGERTVFSNALIQDLTTQGVIQPKPTYERSDYLEMGTKIQQWIDEGVTAEKCTARKLETIADDWLTGKTQFPSDWRIVEVLSEHLPSLKPFAESYQKRDAIKERSEATIDFQEALQMDTPTPDLYNMYRFVHVIKSAAQRSASAPLGKGTGETSEEPRNGKSIFPTSDYNAMICRYLRPFVTEKAFFSPILRAETIELPESAGVEGRKKADPHFKRGFFTGKQSTPPLGSEMPHTTLKEAYLQSMIIVNPIIESIKKYVANYLADEYVKAKGEGTETQVYQKVTYFTDRLFDQFVGTESNPKPKVTVIYVDDSVDGLLETTLNELENNIHHGDLDIANEFAPGTFLRSVRKYNELKRLMPPLLDEAGAVTAQLTSGQVAKKGSPGYLERSELRALGIRRKSLIEKLERRFGIPTNPPLALELMQTSERGRFYTREGLDPIESELSANPDMRQRVMPYSQQKRLLDSLGFKDLVKALNKKLYEKHRFL